MNIAVRVLPSSRTLTQGRVIAKEEALVFPVPRVSLVILVLAVLLSAFTMLYIKNYNQRLFSDYQNLTHNYRALTASSGRLLLEQNAIISRPRLQEVAETELDMQLPDASQVVMVKSQY